MLRERNNGNKKQFYSSKKTLSWRTFHTYVTNVVISDRLSQSINSSALTSPGLNPIPLIIASYSQSFSTLPKTYTLMLKQLIVNRISERKDWATIWFPINFYVFFCRITNICIHCISIGQQVVPRLRHSNRKIQISTNHGIEKKWGAFLSKVKNL